MSVANFFAPKANWLLWKSFDTLTHLELTTIQVRCIVNGVLGASGKCVGDDHTCTDRTIF